MNQNIGEMSDRLRDRDLREFLDRTEEPGMEADEATRLIAEEGVGGNPSQQKPPIKGGSRMINLNQIYAGNALDVLKGWPDAFIDLTVTSPPYDNLREYGGFVFDFQGIAQELWRVTKPGGVVVWVVGDSTVNGSETGTSFKQALYFKEMGFNLHDTMIYYRWSGPLTHNRYEQEFEYMFIFSKGRPKTFNPIMVDCAWYEHEKNRAGKKYIIHSEKNRKMRSGIDRGGFQQKRIMGNVWKMNTSSHMGERYGHPAPFPENLAQDHILSWSNPGDLILDPMLGSGTTAVVAKKLGRKWLGIELNEKYIEMANKRIEGTVTQNTMEGI